MLKLRITAILQWEYEIDFKVENRHKKSLSADLQILLVNVKTK